MWFFVGCVVFGVSKRLQSPKVILVPGLLQTEHQVLCRMLWKEACLPVVHDMSQGRVFVEFEAKEPHGMLCGCLV